MARNELSSIQWHEGMLLSPQHFQQADNFNQMMCSVVGSYSNPFFYGVSSLEIDTSALASGVIRVLKASGMFEDGCFFSYDAVHDIPLDRNLNDYFITHSSAKLYLALPKRRPGENMLNGNMARYYSDELTNISDENIGENIINIASLKPKLRLLLESEIDERYTSFPIFEAEKSAELGIKSSNFIPSYIYVNEHSKISQMCREIVQIIRNKIAYFSDRKCNSCASANEESMAGLRVLIQAALPLEAIIKINNILPFEIYKTLLNTVACVISINPHQFIPRLPEYNHHNLFETFNGLIDYAKNIIINLKQQYNIMQFEKDGNIFKYMMTQELLEKNEIAIGIQRKFSTTEEETLNWIKGLQIASESMISMIKDKRVLGAERRIMQRGEYITQPNNMIIIAIKTNTTYIKSGENLCLINMSHTAIPEEIILYAES